MNVPTRWARCWAFFIDAYRVSLVVLVPAALGTVAIAGISVAELAPAVTRASARPLRTWEKDEAHEKFLEKLGETTRSRVSGVISKVASEIRGAAWNAEGAQRIRERFVDEAKKEPALEKLVDQLAKSYEAISLIAERKDTRADVADVETAVRAKWTALRPEIDSARDATLAFLREVAAYRLSQLASYAGMHGLAKRLKGRAEIEPQRPSVPDRASDPLRVLATIDAIATGEAEVSAIVGKWVHVEVIFLLALVGIALALWATRDAAPAWLFHGRRELGLAVVNANDGAPAKRRALVVRGLVAALLFPIHFAQVALGFEGVAGRLSRTRVVFTR